MLDCAWWRFVLCVRHSSALFDCSDAVATAAGALGLGAAHRSLLLFDEGRDVPDGIRSVLVGSLLLRAAGKLVWDA
jgi:hypothetical protein